MREEGGVRALYRGLIPTAMGVAPYVGACFLLARLTAANSWCVGGRHQLCDVRGAAGRDHAAGEEQRGAEADVRGSCG